MLPVCSLFDSGVWGRRSTETNAHQQKFASSKIEFKILVLLIYCVNPLEDIGFGDANRSDRDEFIVFHIWES
jgi:hypothetical protein